MDRPRIKILSGDWNNINDLCEAICNQDIVFMATGQFIQANKNVVKAMKLMKVNRLIVAGELGIEDEVSGVFEKWNNKMMGNNQNLVDAAMVIKNSKLNYTFMRMAWLYDQENNEKYELIYPGRPFKNAQLTRQAAAKFVADVIENPDLASYQSVGIAEPNTQWEKPSFY